VEEARKLNQENTMMEKKEKRKQEMRIRLNR
jgi:hypothetical protein